MQSKHIQVGRKATKTFNYTLLDEDGEVIDISAGTIIFTAKSQKKDSAVKFSRAGAITSATAGTFSVTLTPTDTDVPEGEYFYDVVVTVSTARYTAERGTLQITRNIST